MTRGSKERREPVATQKKITIHGLRRTEINFDLSRDQKNSDPVDPASVKSLVSELQEIRLKKEANLPKQQKRK